jgi:hypothetical protein
VANHLPSPFALLLISSGLFSIMSFARAGRCPYASMVDLVDFESAAAKAALLKKSTIICVKGKLSKTITAVKPVCPTGYKKK